MVSYYRPELDGLPEMGLVGRQLWAQSGLKPTDIQTAILYDHFTPFTLIQLEELGFCGKGDARDFIADGAIEIGGRLPINMSGGVMSSNPIGASGMLRFLEAARQVRGTAGEHQVEGAKWAMGHAYGGGSQFFSMWIVGSHKP